MTDWRKARADLAARAKASVIVPGWENDLVAAADAYALALALHLALHFDREGEDPNEHESSSTPKGRYWCCEYHKLAHQVEAEHD